jgi:hypothetical protein
MLEGLWINKSNEHSLPDLYINEGEWPRPKLGGQGKAGRGRVQVVFCLVVNKGT